MDPLMVIATTKPKHPGGRPTIYRPEMGVNAGEILQRLAGGKVQQVLKQ